MLSTCLAQVGEIFLNMPILDDGKRVFFSLRLVLEIYPTTLIRENYFGLLVEVLFWWCSQKLQCVF